MSRPNFDALLYRTSPTTRRRDVTSFLSPSSLSGAFFHVARVTRGRTVTFVAPRTETKAAIYLLRHHHHAMPCQTAQGNGLGTALLAFQFLFSGFFISYNDIPKGWRWFSALSMFKWPWEAMVRNMLDEEEDRSGTTSVRQIRDTNVVCWYLASLVGWRATRNCWRCCVGILAPCDCAAV